MAPELLGPMLLPLTVQVTSAPPTTGSGAPTMVADRSAPLLIVVFWLSVLLPRLLSLSLVVTVTVLARVVTVAPVVRSTTVIVRTGPGVGAASVPSRVG